MHPVELPVDESKRSPKRPELCRQRQAGGPRAHDQNAESLVMPGRHRRLQFDSAHAQTQVDHGLFDAESGRRSEET
jgi:hypothetical protein